MGEVLFTVCIDILFITPLVLSEKVLFFYHKPTLKSLDSVGSKLLNRPKSVQIYSDISLLDGCRFLSSKKIWIKNHQSQPTSMTF